MTEGLSRRLFPRIARDGHQVLPDGHQMLPDDHQVWLDGHEMLPDDHQVLLDGHQMLPDGHKVLSHAHFRCDRRSVFSNPSMKGQCGVTERVRE